MLIIDDIYLYVKYNNYLKKEDYIQPLSSDNQSFHGISKVFWKQLFHKGRVPKNSLN